MVNVSLLLYVSQQLKDSTAAVKLVDVLYLFSNLCVVFRCLCDILSFGESHFTTMTWRLVSEVWELYWDGGAMFLVFLAQLLRVF